MIRLAFDTSGPIGSVAVAHGPDVLARTRLERQGRHAADLMPAIAEVLEEAGVDREEVEGVIVGEGPGSFTGVRVAAATAKGLVHALKVPLWAVSSLAAAATTVSSDADSDRAGRLVYVLFDARGDRVYGAAYRASAGGVEEVIAPHAGVLGDALDRPTAQTAIFAGDGAERHRARIEEAGFEVGHSAEDFADGLVRYLALTDLAPVDEPHGWEPSYVRLSSAERLWPTG